MGINHSESIHSSIHRRSVCVVHSVVLFAQIHALVQRFTEYLNLFAFALYTFHFCPLQRLKYTELVVQVAWFGLDNRCQRNVIRQIL